MSYSSNVKIHELEPIYYSANQRAEWRLPPNSIFTTNLVLCNIGVTKSANQANYSQCAGVYGMIRSISLFDGNVELTSLQNAHLWAGWRQFTHSNQYNESIGSYYAGNLVSNEFGARDLSELATGTGANASVSGARIVRGSIRSFTTNTIEDTTYKGTMKMAEILDLLSNMPYIDTSVFKNFRIVIEYHSTTDISLNSQYIEKSNPASITTTRPFLVCEEMLGENAEAVMGKVQPIEYIVIEQDIADLEAVAPDVTGPRVADTATPLQPKTYHISGFNNKTVEKMLIWKQPVNPANIQLATANNGRDVGWGVYNSMAFLGEKVQIRVNGRNIWARSGLDRPNQRLAACVDAWTDYGSLATFANGLSPQTPDATSRSVSVKADGNQDLGVQDFIGVDIGLEKVQDLQIDFERRGFFAQDATQTNQSKYNTQYNIRIFAEVRKMIVPKAGGGYDVRYA
jgi:hypothetical protein